MPLFAPRDPPEEDADGEQSEKEDPADDAEGVRQPLVFFCVAAGVEAWGS